MTRHSPSFERALAFEELVRERRAERVVPFRWGVAVFNMSLPRVWELNLLRVEQTEGATAEALTEEAERVQGEAGLVHRRVSVVDEAAGAGLEADFREAGWRPSRFLAMVHRHPPTRTADVPGVVEVDRATLEPLRARTIGEEPWGNDPETVRQLLEASALTAQAVEVRHFAVVVDGTSASAADLYSDGKTAQIEDVTTLPEYRGRGCASAVVLRALAEAERAGHDFVFLVADDEDWPKELYARLGFEGVGRWYSFLRSPTSAPPGETPPRGRAS